MMKINVAALRNIGLSFFLLLFFAPAFGQNFHSDSLKRIWQNENESDSVRFKAINNYYKNHTFAEPDSVSVVCDYHYNLAKTKNDEGEKSNALNEKSYVYYIKGDFEKSTLFLKQSIGILEKMGKDSLFIAPFYSNMGNIYGEQQKYQEAVRYFTVTLNIYEKENIRKGEARILGNLGIIYNILDRDDLAKKYFEKSIQINKELGFEKRTGSSVFNLASICFKERRFEEAIVKGESAIELLTAVNDQTTIGNCYYLLAKASNALNQLKNALLYVDKSLEIRRSIKNNSRIVESLILRADLVFQENEALGTKNAEDVLKLIKSNTPNELKANLYDLLYRCYKAQDKYDLSLRMLEEQKRYSDSVKVEKDNIAIIEAAIQREFDQKLNETKVKSENDQAAIRTAYSRKIIGIVLTGVILLLVALFFYRKSIRDNRKKRDDLLTELETLKKNESVPVVANSNGFELNKKRLEEYLDRTLNETDWKVLNILLDDPVIPNKEIAARAFLSYDGIGSSLRRMYEYFDIKESKYKKISLLMEAIKISNSANQS